MTTTTTAAAAGEGLKDYDYMFKVLLIGDSGVGKSSILLRYTDDAFDEEIGATIGVDFKLKQLSVDSSRVNLTLWDTAGQEKFRSLTASYYRGVHAVVLVYDVGRADTFQHLPGWVSEADSRGTNPEMVRMLVANKVDVPASAMRVRREEGVAFAREHGMLFFECSAKTRRGIHQAFDELVLKVLDSPQLRRDGSHRKVPSLAPDAEAQPPGSTCLC